MLRQMSNASTSSWSPDMLTALGAYIFAGGFTLGVEKHFRVQAHLEGNNYGVSTCKLNRPWVPVYVGHDKWPTQRFKRQISFVYCNPPCAPFSSAGASILRGKDQWRTDPRTNCMHECFSLLENVEPTVLAIESVTNAFTRGRELFDDFARRANELGYGVTHLLENAKWMDTPQHRKRYFFIASKYQFTHERLNWAPPITVAERLSEVTDPGYHRPVKPELQRYYDQLLQVNGPNGGIRPLWEADNPPETHVRTRFGVKGRPRMMEHRIPLEKPMGAFIGDFHIHPTEPRNLGLNEAKALCGYPLDYRFSNTPGAFSELARGVMPNVGAWLARSVKLTIDSSQKSLLNTQVLNLQDAPSMID